MIPEMRQNIRQVILINRCIQHFTIRPYINTSRIHIRLNRMSMLQHDCYVVWNLCGTVQNAIIWWTKMWMNWTTRGRHWMGQMTLKGKVFCQNPHLYSKCTVTGCESENQFYPFKWCAWWSNDANDFAEFRAQEWIFSTPKRRIFALGSDSIWDTWKNGVVQPSIEMTRQISQYKF